jgi:heme exporter protein C
MNDRSTKLPLLPMLWLTTFALYVVALVVLLSYTPTESTMGPIQKIFYLHLPVAISTFLACFVCFVASIAYMITRRPTADDLAAASARIAVLLCSVVLLTGMIWGRSAWGLWWTWSPRLTFSLILWLLYVVYLMVRMSIESPHRRAAVSAVYAIIAFLDVPLVYLSVRLMPDIHPASIELAPAMRLTLLAWFVPTVLLTACLILARFRLNTQEREAAVLALESATQNSPGPIRWEPATASDGGSIR